MSAHDLAVATALVVLAASLPAWGQQPAPGATPPRAGGGTTGAVGTVAPAAPPAGTGAQVAPGAAISPLPDFPVDDPLLAPLPPPPRMLTSFREAMQIINTRSTDLQIAEQEVERAEGLSRQALGQALPQIDATGSIEHQLIRGERTSQIFQLSGPSVTYSYPVPPTPTELAQIQLSIPVLAPRTWYAIGTTRKNVAAAKLSVEEARRAILASVADAVVNVVTAERVAEVDRVGLRSSLQRLELTERMQRLGSGTKLDVVRAQQDVSAARTTLITGLEAVRRAREALGLALGYPEQVGVPANISLNEVEAQIHAICKTGTPEQRADVRAAKAVLEVDERGITDAKLAYAPSAVASTTASYSSQFLISQKHYSWSIEGVLTIPIWDGGSRYGAVRAAKAIAGEQRARVDATERSATIDATQALRSVDVAVASAREAQRASELATETARLSAIAFQAGTGTSFDLVESGRLARQAELDLAVKEFDVVRARLAAVLAISSCQY